ncbi:formylglycine-generating enzyme family protein [Rhizobium sp. 25PS6]|uniref:Formylglycine-generating enzyme family protein n=1 Tax=Rhizobium aouanii TaxID=3118145 RepID=A0ABU8CTL4_9HYPH|nr:formylglycine-generating enzyme family protein [Rhizobium sp. 25PS6]MDU0364335.1 formylglycine-generating enzyme family protein [Rhizobium sp. 25PS6]
MVWIPDGTFLMGSDSHYAEEAPAHRVCVDGFWMDASTVTNRDFKRFVTATGYVTLAERPANPDDYPGARPEMLSPSSTMFKKPAGQVDKSNHYNWWVYVPGANWRRPRGPASAIAKLMDHPVVHVAYEDAEAYARWAGKELPTEAEWEFAARGGLDGAEFVWGDELTPGGKHMANTWQGDFPYRNTLDDGFEYTAPVSSFPPNDYGLYDMAGNVWQWTADWYQDHGKIDSSCCTAANPRGADRDASYDPRQPAIRIPRKVTKGGSHLCAPNYCRRYRPAARMAQPVETSISHLGFRCIIRGNRASPDPASHIKE